ncbi:uncharacterized protein EDB91DRAFT_42541 [Suillus paluster]|uniref:uncharacterized protein n=1 Tax=Suillus paluster TaxID=48578 RepID=UPI001B86A032|nr:uncharacterized protein EDB91DRAFT_42541 [Suillus paluster]KAG1747729.1 hypothetical protein EDB91DRAFT_42541 [Suillus paluster]
MGLSPSNSLSSPGSPKTPTLTSTLVNPEGKPTWAGISVLRPVLPAEIDDAPADAELRRPTTPTAPQAERDDTPADAELRSVAIPGSYGELRAQPAEVDVLDGHLPTSLRDVQPISVYADAEYSGTAISELCCPPPATVEPVQEYEGPILEQSVSIGDVATEATRPEVEQVGNLLAQLYVEDTPSTTIVHDHPANLQTVSQAEAEDVEALLVSDAHERAIMPMMISRGSGSSLPFVEAKKAPVSEDLVKRVVYTYLMDPATKQNAFSSRTHGLKLDLLFILDLTGSQQPYIDSVKASINAICAEILGSDHMKSAHPGGLRVAFIGFRDHYPQDDTFVTRQWDFVSDITRIHANLSHLPEADGGGDGPEAVTAALARALTMKWRNDCNKVAVLVSDAPPHGIGSQGDYWPYGVPGGKISLPSVVVDSGVLNFCILTSVPDPLDVARDMLKKKITLHFVACEPSLSRFHNALDFYRGLTRITAGIVVPLLDSKVMSTCIIGSALESLAIQDLINEYRETLEELVSSRDPSLVVKYLHALMRIRGRTADQLIMENIYDMSGDRKENVEIWSSARNLADAKARLKRYY